MMRRRMRTNSMRRRVKARLKITRATCFKSSRLRTPPWWSSSKWLCRLQLNSLLVTCRTSSANSRSSLTSSPSVWLCRSRTAKSWLAPTFARATWPGQHEAQARKTSSTCGWPQTASLTSKTPISTGHGSISALLECPKVNN